MCYFIEYIMFKTDLPPSIFPQSVATTAGGFDKLWFVLRQIGRTYNEY